jgi:hypothetical protein
MTPRGQRQALQEALVGNHGKAWARANATVVKARKQIAARDAALVIKDPDQSYAGVHGRWEARQWLLSLEPSVRQAVAETTEDIRILEAMVTAPPQLSGVNLPASAAKIERRYKEVMYPAELAAIAADDAVVAVAEACMYVQRNELRSTLDNNMQPRDFDELMKPIEVDRPWLTSDRKQVVEINADGTASYHPASQAEIDDGVEYKNVDEYRAAQGLAA